MEHDGLEIILDDYRQRYEPTFRRGCAIYSRKLSREVKPGEATYAPDRALLGKLAQAGNAPRDKNGVDAEKLVGFFWLWARVAWAELLGSLPDEEASAEVSPAAEEEFRRHVSAGLFAQATFTVASQHPERRTLLQWCLAWAKPLPPWQQIRSALLWCRREANDRLAVALRVELFGQYGPNELAQMPQRRFAALAAMYGVGTSSEGDRPGGRRAVVLAPEYLAALLETPAVNELPADAPTRTRGRSASAAANRQGS